MKRKIVVWLIGFLTLSFLLGFNLQVSQARKNEEEFYRQLERFVNVVNVVKDEYVNPVDDKKLISGAMKGMLSSLDPYSAYLEPEANKELQIETQGEFEGVGMEITIKDEIITVVSPIEDTPAWKAGVKTGDRIIEIDGQSTKGMSTSDAARKLRGKRGTQVVISLLREKATKIMKITLTRDVIKIKSVRTKFLQDGIGYVRISEFQEQTAADLENAIKSFNLNNEKGLILDLRYNPGGLLTSAIDVSNIFLQAKKLIVFTQGKKPEDKKYFFAQKTPLWTGPVVIMINNGSASASEIVTGALRDNLPGTCKTLGEKSFGKGSVQNLIPLEDDGSAIKLTVAYYYTPSGTRIDGKGIKPDIEVEEPEMYEIGNPEKDLQLQKAFEAIRNMTLPVPVKASAETAPDSSM